MDWFTTLTGLPDDSPATVRAGIAVEGEWLVSRGNGRRMRAGRLSLPALADLPLPGDGPMALAEIVADVADLHADPANAGAVFQVASQFNLLEMVGPHVTPDDGIARYAHDHTQGPACAMSCGAGTIWRNYLMPLAGGRGQDAGRQIDTIADLGAALGNAGGALWDMRNGYLLPHPGALARIAAAIRGQEPRLRGLLRLGVQADTEVTRPGGGHCVTQIYASALPVAYGRGAAAEWEPFARLVLEAAYQATFAIAAQAGARRLFLTRLGGGAFGNRPGWIDDAILAAARRHPVPGLQVGLVSYGHPDPANRALLARWPAHGRPCR